jgi:hypothetical protein
MRVSRICTLLLLAAAGGFAGCGDKTTAPANRSPRIIDLIARPAAVIPGGLVRVSALVADSDGDPLTYLWSATGGAFTDSSGSVTNWIAPDSAGAYTVFMRATDTVDTVSSSVDIGVGSARLTVLSEPAGAFVSLDGSPTGLTTPTTFAPLAPGSHIAAVSSPYFAYAFSSLSRTLEHADDETLRFEIRAPTVSNLSLGRGDILEIGGIAFLPDGSGVVYGGRTAAGTGLFSASVFTNPASGVLLRASVCVEEPLGITADGAYVLFVSEGDSLYALPIQDDEGDGVVDMVGTAVALRKNAFGPAVSRTDDVAFSLTASGDPAITQLLHGDFDSGTLLDVQLATTSAGRLPAWKPNEPFLAFVRDGLILYNFLGDGGPASSDTLVSDGFNTAPAWGKWGPASIAHLHGPDAQTVTAVRLAAAGTPYTALISDSLEDPRFVAWDPALRRFAVTHNPGGGAEILVFSALPIP